MALASILDPIHDTLDPAVWENPGQAEPRLKHQHLHWIKSTIQGTLEKHGYENVEDWATYYLTGSLTTYQYAPDSDVDISIYVNTQSFPEWSRSEMIGLMISEFGDDGTKLPGTQHPLQVYVVPAGTQPSDIYMPGLRSAYDLQSDSWFVAPEKSRAHDVQAEYRRAYAMALDGADKMELLLQYEPHKAIQYYDQVHRRRMHDQQAGKGDYSDSNIIYKFLEKRGLAKQALDYKRMEKGAMFRMAAGDHQSVLDANRGQDLAGLPPQANVPGYGPLSFGSHADIQRVAQEYNQQAGIQTPHPTDYVPVNPQTAQRIAQEYEQMPHAPDDPQVRGSYDALKSEALSQYQHAVNNGYQFEFYPEDHDPYPNSPREAVLDLHHNKHMYVYPTEQGFGQGETQNHPMLEHTGLQWNEKPVTYNDVFRAIHDFYGHAKEGVGFRHDGEDNAYRQHAAMFSPAALPAMTAETRGQNSWVNFGPHGEQNQTAGQGDTIYAPQKAGVMPSWTTDPNVHAPRVAAKKLKVVRKWVYNDNTGELHHTDFGPEEGAIPSHYQLARGWGIDNPYSDPNVNLGTISQSGWVQFEGGGGNAKSRYRAQQAIKDKFGEQLEGFLGGEMNNPEDLGAVTPTWSFGAPPTT